jgi:hypothetical protein
MLQDPQIKTFKQTANEIVCNRVIKPLLTEAEFILISMHARVQNPNVQNCLVL